MNFKTLKKIIENGGATLNKNGQAVNFKRGYQVSKKDCFILKVDELQDIFEKTTNLLKAINNNEFVGLWVDNGKIYIDISIKIGNLQTATEFGKELKQLSIFNWATKNCIFL